jgi:hypothetical protein
MRVRFFLTFAVLLASLLLLLGCGTQANCPTCGTTQGGTFRIINTIPVPEHNPTGEPGGPFNSFDIGWVDSVNHRFTISDRIGLDVPVFDTIQNVALYSIGGDNVVSSGTIPAPCDSTATPPIPPLLTAFNASLYAKGSGDPSTASDFTRFGCRTKDPADCDPGTPGSCIYFFNLYGQFGPSGDFGGWAGAQCCASRSNGVNPISCPCGEIITLDGRFLIVGNSSSSVEVFDLGLPDDPTLPNGAIAKGMVGVAIPPPKVIASIPTGASPDFDGQPNGVAPCVSAWTGRAGSDPSCGDDRADEISFDELHKILMVDNGDPGQAFVTMIDLSEVLGDPKAPSPGVGTADDDLGGPHCYPVNPNAPYNNLPPGLAIAPNPPKCIIGQIFYDLLPVNTINSSGNPCPFPSNGFTDTVNPPASTPVPAGITAALATKTNTGVPPCVHDDLAPAGLGGSVWIAGTGLFITTNPNYLSGGPELGTPANATDPHFGKVEVVDPTGFKKCDAVTGTCPVVVAQLVLDSCMPGSVIQGPGNQFLIGCITHDGMQFPPVEFVYDFTNPTAPTLVRRFDQVGGVDEIWFNPGDQNYYLAARDMTNGPKLGVINATINQWLENVPTNSNSHSVSADSMLNHVFVPMQSGGPCGTLSSAGCVGVFGRE